MSENILTAIIADDSSIDRDILMGFAKDAGINVLTTVASGDWLIDDCSRYQPDIIIENIAPSCMLREKGKVFLQPVH